MNCSFELCCWLSLLYDILFNDHPKHIYNSLKGQGYVGASGVEWSGYYFWLYQYILRKKVCCNVYELPEHNGEYWKRNSSQIHLWKKPFMNHLQVIAVLQMQQRNEVPLSVLHKLLLKSWRGGLFSISWEKYRFSLPQNAIFLGWLFL